MAWAPRFCCSTWQESPQPENLRGFWEGASKVHEIRAELFSCASTLMAYCSAKEECMFFFFGGFFETWESKK